MEVMAEIPSLIMEQIVLRPEEAVVPAEALQVETAARVLVLSIVNVTWPIPQQQVVFMVVAVVAATEIVLPRNPEPVVIVKLISDALHLTRLVLPQVPRPYAAENQ